MEVENVLIPAINPLAAGYSEGDPEIQKHFHYDFRSGGDYKQRLNELARRPFLREELAEYISSFMKPFPSSDKVAQSLEKLRFPNSAVVIGGQQAGILTGPLYTIHKIISIIVLSRKKERELGIPVVPVFWIAGEDHDYQEVNHVFLPYADQIEKYVYPEKIRGKRMISDCPVNKEICMQWTKSLIAKLGETEYTNELLQMLEEAALRSQTFVDYFAFLIMSLFKDHGLLIVDSGDPGLRQLEKHIFVQQIESAGQILKAVRSQQEILSRDGFTKAIDLHEKSANLFFYDKANDGRILLTYDERRKMFSGKNGFPSFSIDELFEMARESPEKLSNNVVTRPLTQELLFPTLAFIAGPGEIAYWAELKQVFELFQIKMPVIVPRLNITLLERNIESLLGKLGLDAPRILQKGARAVKESFINGVKNQNISSIFAEMKRQLQRNYQLLAGKVERDVGSLLPLIRKNEVLLMKQLDFLQEKMEEAFLMKDVHQLRKIGRIENSLRPFGWPQERIWNVLYFLNKYGLNFADELCELLYDFDGNHKIVKL